MTIYERVELYNVQDDLVFRTHYNSVQGVKALKVALNNFSEVDE